MYKNFKAEWTGSYPCLCSGEWKLTAEATDVL
nr:MAG TPA: Kti11, Kti13 transfer, tRNA modification, Complex [Caudoviricetes sp.]